MHAAGIFSLRDLLYTLPSRYEDLSRCVTVEEARAGERATLCLRRLGEPKLARFHGMTRVTCALGDETGTLTGVWFNQPWMKEALMKRMGETLVYGMVERFGGHKQMNNPAFADQPRIVPIYRSIEGVAGKTHEGIVRQALEHVEELCPEAIPAKMREERGLMDCAEAIRTLHVPPDLQRLSQAQKRETFEQLLIYQLAVARMRRDGRSGAVIPCAAGALDDYWRTLPFCATGAQRRTLIEIARDLAQDAPMARMVQGDVGCGKTAVAFGAMKLCADAGFQSALMAPTEILACQHYESAQRALAPLGVRCGLLVGGMRAAQRRQALENIATGQWNAVIGTHALISKDVRYARLGLCVTDEQHRFGVEQRTALLCKGDASREPNLLVMSATPIPRSLALALFGDLDVSVVDELPPGRSPVQTRLVPERKRKDMYRFVREHVQKGEQAYIVCPLVEEGDTDLKAAQSHLQTLEKGELAGLRIGLTHGRQKGEEKESVLSAFARGELDVLVATTVIEVGVNVPSATMMIIEDANRYGLSQLHQLRGRVGRGTAQSWCFLMANEDDDSERLRVLTTTNDGFEISREDLRLRGPGEFLGVRQHGMPALPAGVSLLGDTGLLHDAAECVRELAQTPEYRSCWEELQRQAAQTLQSVSERVSLS